MCSEIYHADKWHTDETYLAPMMVHPETGEHIYVGDIVVLKEDNSIGKVMKFFTVSYDDKLKIIATRITNMSLYSQTILWPSLTPSYLHQLIKTNIFSTRQLLTLTVPQYRT